MPALPLTVANYSRPSAHLPNARLVNAYIEATEGGPAQSARIPRPNLTLALTAGLGPITAEFSQPGVFGGAIFSVSGNRFYKDTTLLGVIEPDAAPSIVASEVELTLVSGGRLYVYDGVTFRWVRTFDDNYSLLPAFSSVGILSGQCYYTVADSNQFFWSEVLNAGSINALSFANAETSPDGIVTCIRLGDEMVFFGASSVEWWSQTGALDLPISLSPGRTYARGCAAKASVVQLDNALFFVGDDRVVYRTSTIPLRISTPGVEDALNTTTDIAGCRAYPAYTTGHLFNVLIIPGKTTFTYDCQTREWAEWASYGRETFIGQTGSLTGQSAQPGVTYIGSAIDGRIWRLDERAANDDGEPKEVLCTGAIWIPARTIRCNNVSLACVRGVGTAETTDPLVVMRYSDDAGRTWSSWLEAELGGIGGYDVKATWWGLGLMSQPGRMFEFRVTDDVPFTIEGATYNEARP